MKSLRTLVLAFILVSMLGVGAVLADEPIVFTGDTSGGDTFDPPDDDCVGEWDTGIKFVAHEFSVSEDGSYRIDLESNEFDTYLILYINSFDPDEPNDNCLEGDDDGGIALESRITADLTAGQTYIAVAAGYDDTEEGAYTLTISGPGNFEDNNGGVAGNLLDGRLNNNSALDVAAPVAVYFDEGSFKIYGINPANGEGAFVLLVEVATLEAGQTNSVLLGQIAHPYTGALISVYVLPSGEYQLNTTAFDGKPYWTVFSAPAV